MISDHVVMMSEVANEDVEIAPFVYIEKNVTIGHRVKIHPHVTISEGVEIGDDVEIFPGAYIGKIPKGPALGSNTQYDKKLVIEKGCIIGPNAVLYYGDHIGAYSLIGDNVSIRENVTIGEQCIIGRSATINYAVSIGKKVKIMDLAHITAHTVIHDSAFVGPHVCTADDNQFGKNDKEDAALIGGAEIGENANIGLGALLLPKTKVGENVVVGAGSVVTRNVEADTVVMGIPARKVSS